MQAPLDSKPYDTINVTPMLDLAYVLLVIFILMTTASIQGLDITLPRPSDRPSSEQHELKVVQITADGSLLLNGVGMSIAELRQQLAAAKSRDPKMSVAIRGDARSHYAQVVAVVDLCNSLQVDMGLVTTRIGT